jgi:hypothetical protein
MLKTWPVENEPLPAPAPPSGFAVASRIVSSVDQIEADGPVPPPVETVTVRVAPLPVTPVTLGATLPVVLSAKSAASTPVTLSLKVVVNWIELALVGVGPTRAIETTVGGVATV